MIHGVRVTPLSQFLDERGKVMRMLSSEDAHFEHFGEIYFSCVYPGAIKGWHIHKHMTLNYAVPYGNIKFVLFDERKDSPSRGKIQEIFMGADNYCLVTVPPLVWNGFKGIGSEMAVIANCASLPHSPEETNRRDPFDPSIPYDWNIKHR